MKRLFTLGVFISTWLAFASHIAIAGTPDRTVTDMVGRKVTVPDHAHRLVTTFKPASLCVTALGLHDRLVGIDSDSRKSRLQLVVDPAISDLPAVGQKTTGLNFEAILSVNPDLVILFSQKDGIAIADRLVDHGVAAIVVLPETLSSLYETLRLIANAAGVPERAEQTIAACHRLVNMARQRVVAIKPEDRKVVYFASPLGLFVTASGDMLQDEIIREAGGLHAGHALSGYFREISPEQFIAWNPDMVVMSSHGNIRAQGMLEQLQFARVSAVMSGSIYAFPSNIAPWDFPSPLSALAVLWLGKTCYPEKFGDVDLEAEIDQFHQALFGKGFEALGGKLSK